MKGTRGRVLGSTIMLALNTIREHKMRAFLTVLGVIIGTGTIIAVGSVITGLDGAIVNVLKSFGANNAMVFKWQFLHAPTPEEWQRKPLTYEDALAIQERCPAVLRVSPYLFTPGAFGARGGIDIIRYKGNAADIATAKANPDYMGRSIQAFYSDLQHPSLTGSAAAASEALKAAGIPGIRYLDGGSRADGSGTSNHVIFDPATIAILRKYGIAGLVAGGAAAAAGSPPPSQ